MNGVEWNHKIDRRIKKRNSRSAFADIECKQLHHFFTTAKSLAIAAFFLSAFLR